MYINKKFIKQVKLSIYDILVLQLIKQNVQEDNSAEIKHFIYFKGINRYVVYENKGLIKHVKAKNKQETAFHTIRLSKKGKEVLKYAEMANVGYVEEEVYVECKKMWDKKGKDPGSKSKALKLIAWYMAETGVTKEEFINSVKNFMFSLVDMEKVPYICNMIWKPSNLYATNPKLDESWLWRINNK